MKCQRCGAEVASGFNFCGACGRPVEVLEEEGRPLSGLTEPTKALFGSVAERVRFLEQLERDSGEAELSPDEEVLGLPAPEERPLISGSDLMASDPPLPPPRPVPRPREDVPDAPPPRQLQPFSGLWELPDPAVEEQPRGIWPLLVGGGLALIIALLVGLFLLSQDRPKEEVKGPLVAAATVSRGADAGVDGGPKAEDASPPPKSARAQAAKGSIDVAGVRRVVTRHKDQIRVCYERAMKKAGSFGGRVEVRFRVNASGAVESARAVANSTRNSEVAGCVVKLLRRWRFPAPVGGSADIQYPFVFSSHD